MEQLLKQRLANQIASGKLILFTGAGFSLAASNKSGNNVAGVSQLRQALWEIAFPDVPFDEESSLGDIYEVAVKRAGGKVGQLLKDLFIIDSKAIPNVYRKWFSFPWLRIYTLNIDDLDEAANRSFDLPRRIEAISALSNSYPEETSSLTSIHLNGRVLEYPKVTFSPRQYGERAALHDPWFYHLVSDLVAHPILFVGTVLDEPLFWQHIELRRSRGPQHRELRPGSYLVTPTISTARKAMLDDFNVKLIEMTQEEFMAEVLEKMETERLRGLSVISLRQSASAGGTFLQDVNALRTQRDDNSGDFLLGREPFWSDITSGRAINRAFESEIKESIEKGNEHIVVLTGTAGSGKSTTLMRLALEYEANGKNVGWLDSEADIPLWKVREAVRNSDFQVLIIDDADNFGSSAGSLLADILSDKPDIVVIAAMRSTKFDRFHVDDYLQGHKYLLYAIPHLDNSDIELLIQVLTKANRLGYLRGLSHQEQVRAFQEQAGRQLLVAMIQATSNERFEEKIDSECRDLIQDKDLSLIYCIVAIATTLRGSLTRDEILLASGDPSNEQLNRIDRLLSQRLLLSSDAGLIRLRHKVVAERVVDYYRRQGAMRDAIIGILWAIANNARANQNRKSREQKLLLQLINHQILINLTSDQATPRLAYAEVEEILGWNFHYYLQRGSFEVEAGDIDLAKNFLDQARAMAPDDYLVQTEWAYMTLKRAAMNASSLNAIQSADEAFAELEDAIERRGKSDYYPYHVLGSQGLSWARRIVASTDEKFRLLSRILNIVSEGAKLHPRSKELDQLVKDIQRARLLLATK